MAEETEDVKPKIDLTINYEGQSQHLLCLSVSLPSAHCGKYESLTCLVNDLSRSMHGEGEDDDPTEEGFRSCRGTHP